MPYESIRKLLCPFNKIAALVPSTGKILDVGCGHGTFVEILAKNHPQRQILGIDPSAQKITIAKKKRGKYKNTEFINCFIKDLKKIKFDCIIIIDVLYLISNNKKLNLLKKAHSLLKNNGVLIVKTDSQEPKILFDLLKIEETFMVKILKFTFSQNQKVYFTSKGAYRNVIKKAGFKVDKEMTFTSVFPYRHPTFVARKR